MSLFIFLIDKSVVDLYEPFGTIQSTGYPLHLRTNMEYHWNIRMSDSNEIEINLLDIHLDDQNDYLQIVVGKEQGKPKGQRNFVF